MPRLTNTMTGVVVNVDDATAAQLGADWSPVESKADSADEAKPTRKPRARKEQ
jgi:hypothetical protein